MNNSFIFGIVLITSVVVWDLSIYAFGILSYDPIFSIFCLLYLFFYLWPFFNSKYFPSLGMSLMFFFILKLFIIFKLNYLSDVQEAGSGGDGETFHIPRALEVGDNFFQFLFTLGGHYNGRFTQVLLAIDIEILKLLNINVTNGSIFNVAFCSNLMLCLLTIFVCWKSAYKISFSKLSANRAVWFLVFNPYFINITSLPQKEALLFLSISLFGYSLVVKKNSICYLLGSFVLLAFERVYMIPLFVVVKLLVDKKMNFKALLLIVCGYIFIESYVGIDVALFMLESNAESMMEGDSYLGEFNLLNNFIRIYFGPFALRNYLEGYVSFDLISNSHYYLLFFYPFLAFYSTIYRRGFGIVVFISLIFIAVLIPYHSSLKILLLVYFGGMHLACSMNFISYKRHSMAVEKSIVNFNSS